MAGSYLYLPLAALLVAMLAATTTAVAVVAGGAGAADKYSGRMVIIRAPGARVVAEVSAGGAAFNKWQQRRRRRLVEDEVAPEFGGLGQLGAGNGGGHVSTNAENKDRPVCLPDGSCAAQGGSYTRPCTYKDHCEH